MKVICSWHKPAPIVIGENCPACGDRAIVLGLLDLALCFNPSCSVYTFIPGTGAATHGMCAECKAAMLSEIKPPAELVSVGANVTECAQSDRLRGPVRRAENTSSTPGGENALGGPPRT